jgi:hypothetical protein
MTIRIIIVGYEPPSDLSALKPRDRRNAEYFNSVLQEHNLGEVHFATYQDYREKLDALNPMIAVTFDETTAGNVRGHKNDIFIYVVDTPSSIFYRKAEVESRQEKHQKIFKEIAGLIQKIVEDGEEKAESARKYAAMTFQDKYDMVVQMLISDDEKTRRLGFEFINRNDIDRDFIWIRAKLVTDLWQNADAKGRQGFMEATMQGHLNSGFAHQMENFIDDDGQVYKQYMFHDVRGEDVNEIHLIPVASPGMGKYDYETLANKYRNLVGSRANLEAGLWKKERDTSDAEDATKFEDSPIASAKTSKK